MILHSLESINSIYLWHILLIIKKHGCRNLASQSTIYQAIYFNNSWIELSESNNTRLKKTIITAIIA